MQLAKMSLDELSAYAAEHPDSYRGPDDARRRAAEDRAGGRGGAVLRAGRGAGAAGERRRQSARAARADCAAEERIAARDRRAAGPDRSRTSTTSTRRGKLVGLMNETTASPTRRSSSRSTSASSPSIPSTPTRTRRSAGSRWQREQADAASARVPDGGRARAGRRRPPTPIWPRATCKAASGPRPGGRRWPRWKSRRATSGRRICCSSCRRPGREEDRVAHWRRLTLSGAGRRCCSRAVGAQLPSVGRRPVRRAAVALRAHQVSLRRPRAPARRAGLLRRAVGDRCAGGRAEPVAPGQDRDRDSGRRSDHPHARRSAALHLSRGSISSSRAT